MIQNTIALLGLKGRDKITGYEGVITSACFDLYGCVQVALNPPMAKDGTVPDGRWFDVSRVDVSPERVMAAPSFAGYSRPSDYDKGPAEKPEFPSGPLR